MGSIANLAGYLFHMPVVLGLIALIRKVHPAAAWFPLWYAATLCGSILLGSWIARHYSEPLNRRLRATSGLAFSRTDGRKHDTARL